MSAELIAIIVVGVVLAGIILVSSRAFRAAIKGTREDTDKQP